MKKRYLLACVSLILFGCKDEAEIKVQEEDAYQKLVALANGLSSGGGQSAIALSSSAQSLTNDAPSGNYRIVPFQMPKGALSTSFGELAFQAPEEEGGGDYSISLNGKKIFETSAMGLKMPFHIKSSDFEIFLISEFQGGQMCPEMHYWLKIDKNGAKETEDFTECTEGENLKVTQSGEQIRLELDTYGEGGHQSFCMDPKTLKTKKCS